MAWRLIKGIRICVVLIHEALGRCRLTTAPLVGQAGALECDSFAQTSDVKYVKSTPRIPFYITFKSA